MLFSLFPVVTYDVEITTGDEDEAGTRANIYINLKGKQSDTGKRYIVPNPGDTSAFSKGHTDKFTLEAVSLGPLEKCIIGHDGRQPGALPTMFTNVA